MRHFLLVHGAWHGAWCWQEIIKHLPRDIQATVIDLPTIQSSQTQFNDYILHISNIIEKSSVPVTLVGHSFAGFLISQLGCDFSKKVHELIYLNAFIPVNGESLFSLCEKLSSKNLNAHLKFDSSQNTVALEPKEIYRKYMYNQSQISDIELNKIKAEPLQPLNHPVQINHQFQSIAKRAIIAKHDLTLNECDQIYMCQRQYIPYSLIDADHCPFYSKPKLIAELLTTPEENHARRNP